jgi:hypothetical protein
MRPDGGSPHSPGGTLLHPKMKAEGRAEW